MSKRALIILSWIVLGIGILSAVVDISTGEWECLIISLVAIGLTVYNLTGLYKNE